MLNHTIRVQPQDKLMPLYPRTYWDFMHEISPDDLYEGLLGFGLFADKLPPIFTSEQFMQYSKTKNCSYSEKCSNWIRFSYMRNTNNTREFGIPNPFAYEKLVRHLKENWATICSLFKQRTDDLPYRISRIHIRKQKGTQALFKMNYHNWQIDEDPLPALMIGNRFRVQCDISKCFPSIYTHALDWAIIGKPDAKRNRKGRVCPWSHDLDRFAMLQTNNETHGVLIGPHTSNLLAEIILTRIDRSLFDKGFRFTRHIDDYSCYVDSEKDAREFVLKLSSELSNYGLSLNQKKTEIQDLPLALNDDWVRALKDFRTDSARCDKGAVARFLDIAIAEMKKANGNASTLLYAFKVISHLDLTYWARRYYGAMALHLTYAYPYLLPSFESTVIEIAKIPTEHLKIFSNLLFDKALKERDYLSACYAIYYSIRYQFLLDSLQDYERIDSILKANDCLLYLSAYLYAESKNYKKLQDSLKTRAKELAMDEDDFQQFWLFTYEALDRSSIPGKYNAGAWKELKNHGISFIDRKSLSRELENEIPVEELAAALNELNDPCSQTDDRTLSQVRNEL